MTGSKAKGQCFIYSSSIPRQAQKMKNSARLSLSTPSWSFVRFKFLFLRGAVIEWLWELGKCGSCLGYRLIRARWGVPEANIHIRTTTYEEWGGWASPGLLSTCIFSGHSLFGSFLSFRLAGATDSNLHVSGCWKDGNNYQRYVLRICSIHFWMKQSGLRCVNALWCMMYDRNEAEELDSPVLCNSVSNQSISNMSDDQ
jgi:hypothetical protein